MSGTNPPPPTATEEQLDSAGQDGSEVFVQSDDAMALPSGEQRESSDESEGDVDFVQVEEEEPSPDIEDGVAGEDVTYANKYQFNFLQDLLLN